jgi:hypothetical protein
MDRRFLKWIDSRIPALLLLLLLLLLLAVASVSLAISYGTWRLIDRMNRPELSINDVYINQNDNMPYTLVIAYQNVGRANIDWLEINVAMIGNDRVVQKRIAIVRANPVPAGAAKMSVTDAPQVPPILALCVRWLDDRHALSSSQWYYGLDMPQRDPKVQRYTYLLQRERAIVTDLNPCAAVSGNLP